MEGFWCDTANGRIITNLTFGIGFIFLSAAWWPSALEFVGIHLPLWLFLRISTLLFMPGIWIIVYGINRLLRYPFFVDVVVFLLGLPLYLIVLVWAERYVIVVDVGGYV